MLYTASLLIHKEHNVKITDFNYARSSLSDVIGDDDSDAYGFWTIFLSRDLDRKWAAKISTLKPSKPIVFMGTDPTHNPDQYLTARNRFVVRGEPEYTVLDFVDRGCDPENVTGISFSQGGAPKHNPPRGTIENLDELPFPNRELISGAHDYCNPRFRSFPSTTILTSRGCSYRCTYCVPNSLSFARELEHKRFNLHKPAVRLRSVESITEEFRQISASGFRSVSIVDDIFPWGDRRTVDICNKIAPLGLELACLARADHLLNLETVKAMADAGFSHIDFGFESFNQAILDDIHKDATLESYYQAVENLRRCGIEPEINILLGASPLETIETIKETEQVLQKLDPEIVHVQICTPFPGTEFNERAKENGWITTGEYIPIDPTEESIISYPHLSAKDLEESLRRINRRRYLRPRYIARQFFGVKSRRELSEKAKLLVRMIRKWGIH